MLNFKNYDDQRFARFRYFTPDEARLKHYYSTRRSQYLEINPLKEDDFDEIFLNVIDLAQHDTFIIADRIRRDIQDADAGDDAPGLEDERNLHTFLTNLNNAVEITFDLADMVIHVEDGTHRFTSIKAVSIAYTQGQKRVKKIQSGKGTRVEAAYHFHDLYLALKGRSDAEILPHVMQGDAAFEDYRDAVIGYFGKMLTKSVRETKTGPEASRIERRFHEGRWLREFGRAVTPLAKYMYKNFTFLAPDYPRDKAHVCRELCALYGLPAERLGSLPGYFSIGHYDHD